MTRIIFALLLIIANSSAAYAADKANIFVVNPNDRIGQVWKKGLTSALERKEKIDSYRKIIDEGVYEKAVNDLEELLKNEDYYWFSSDILDLILDAHERNNNLELAIKTQKRIIQLGQSPVYINREISGLWDLIDKYKMIGGHQAESLDEKSATPKNIDKQVREKFKRSGERYIQLILALYYYKHLYFEEAEEVYWRGLRTQRVDYHDNAEDYLFHQGLLGLYMIEGKYAEALQQNEWFLRNTNDKTTTYYHNILDLSSFLKKAEQDKLDPNHIKYGSDANGYFVVSRKN